MQQQWLISLDLDGTLFHADHEISVRTLDTLHKVVEHGHSVIINTGRSSFSSVPRLNDIPEGIRLICSNGAYEYDRPNQSIVWSKLMPAPLATAVKQLIYENIPTASFGWESVSGLTYEANFVDEAGGAHTLEQDGLETVLGQHDLLKLFVRSPELVAGELVDTLQSLLRSDIEVSTSGVPFVEITAPGINKGSALAKVASDLGFEQKFTMAFGDNLNDAPMLRWAGESVAMGNAIDEIKVLSNSCTLSNVEDGVAHYLENRLLLT